MHLMVTLQEGLTAAGEIVTDLDWQEQKKSLNVTYGIPIVPDEPLTADAQLLLEGPKDPPTPSSVLPKVSQEKLIEGRKSSTPIVERRADP